MFGSLLGAIITEHYHPKWSFLIYSMFGLIVAVLGTALNKSVESDDEEKEEGKKEELSLIQELKRNAASIKEAAQMPEVYRTILYLLLAGLTSPSFSEYFYFFQMNVIKFSKFQYAMLGVLGYASLTLGTMFYNRFLSEKEIRFSLQIACWIGVFGSLVSLCFVMRWNLLLGISDIAFVVLTDVVLGTLGLAYT